MKIVLDTSALMSLAAGGVLDGVVMSIECIVPERVRAEIDGLRKNNSFEGNLAKSIWDLFGDSIEVCEAYKNSSEGEIECAYLANELEEAGFLITDDTQALQRLEKICKKPVRFSPIVVYAFWLKKKITRQQALAIIERMRVKRGWKDNLIFEQALMLLKSMEKD